MNSLSEIKQYWREKYPHVLVNLWENQDGSKFFGIMMSPTEKQDITADTLGQLISHGEAFLRKVNN